ncbi:MAG: hypothetical protein HYT48_03485 [Candidatus Vogelbacteria bacterium]|nr:hypothetical protein [Candidatus Vogelbacteria bacterium]
MKKYILLGVLLCALIITPALAQTDNSALIAQLRAQIAALLAQLQALQGGLGTPTPFCWNPNWTNMRIGDRGTGVGTLQEILRQEGFTIAAEERQGVSISDAEFGESTAAAVSGFQEKYADEILRPNGLARGTGYVGPSTRGKLNRLHACKRPIPIPIPVPGAPVINGVSGPTSLGVGVSGEWKVIASGSGVLSYSVIWGDEGLYGSGMGSSGVTRSNTQTATFNHTYNQAGVYKVGFTVTNESGQSTQTSISVRVGDVSTQPAINVTSPNEASIFSQGDILKIRWNNIGTPVRLIQIWLQGPLDGTLTGELSRSVIGANLLNDGDYDWSISNSIVSGKYQIHVRDNSNPDFGGKSGVFIISNATQPTITVLSPNGGESWQKGTAQAITWRDNRQTFAPANWTYNIYLVAR